uniref:DRBM domain-containing protein n=1 Tax=Panagrellus redivivus TaxID=6233 RepID=A0A7E4W2L3_PANRE
MVSFSTAFKLNKQQFAPEPWCGKHLNESEPPAKNVYHYATRKEVSEKTPMCMVAELARYHKLKHEYVLLDEDGPAHKKRFTVKLVLRESEIYEGSGPSIKKAQQNAAKVALEKTMLLKPPAKTSKAKKDPNSPTALLAHVADKLNIEVSYKDVCPPRSFEPPPMALMNVPIPPHGRAFNPSRFYRPFMPPGGPPQMCYQPVRMPPIGAQKRGSMKGPRAPAPQMPPSTPQAAEQPVYTSHCYLTDGHSFTAEGKSRFESRCAAATKALTHLQPRLAELESKVRTAANPSSNSSESGRSEEETNGNKENHSTFNLEALQMLIDEDYVEPPYVPRQPTPEPPRNNRKNSSTEKSVVSQVHEYALRLKMNVEFEVLKEAGEPHKREFVLRCQLNADGKEPIETEGFGTSKRNAKQDACTKMLEKLKGIENDPLYLASMIVMTSKKISSTASLPKEPKRKTIVKDLKKDPHYGHHINPVSRLIQVRQIQELTEPEFVLINETGQNRYKVFTIECRCDGKVFVGSGPNKKLAKRAAAEAMLDSMGYVKPMPQPGKSLLKRRPEDEPVEIPGVPKIGVFDPNDLLPKPDPIPDPIGTPRSAASMETFADVDSAHAKLDKTEQPGAIGGSKSADEVPNDRKSSTTDAIDGEPAPMQKRRVTFSNEVAACPPPEDANYPIASFAPLRSEVIIVSKPKKRGKDSKKTLTSDETSTIATRCRQFVSYHDSATELRGYSYPDNPVDGASTYFLSAIIVTAKERLESLAMKFKFTVTYCDFPTTTDEAGKPRFFSLVTIGLSKPVVEQGFGPSQESAHQHAAYNGISKLALLDDVDGDGPAAP